MPGYRTCRHFEKAGPAAKTCHYGLPGICKCIKRHAKKHSSYFFLDSFSRYKGDLQTQIDGVKMLDKLKDGDTILMAEGCTHHRQCDDIGTVKLPRWISEYTGKKLNFATSSGGGFPENLSPYRLIVHCGGCTLSKREMAFRIAEAKDQNVPIVNYGTMIAQLKGVLKEVSPHLLTSYRNASPRLILLITLFRYMISSLSLMKISMVSCCEGTRQAYP